MPRSAARNPLPSRHRAAVTGPGGFGTRGWLGRLWGRSANHSRQDQRREADGGKTPEDDLEASRYDRCGHEHPPKCRSISNKRVLCTTELVSKQVPIGGGGQNP